MISSDVDLSSELLARRLQEEEDQRAAFQLQHQFNRGPIRLGRVPTHALNISPGPSTSAVPVQYYVASDEEPDDDVRELSFVQLSDDEMSDRVIPMSPDTDRLVTDALNTAFTTPVHTSRSSRVNQTSDDVVILDDSVVEDSRPPRTRRQPSSDESDNLVLTVGRSTRSQTRASSISSSIVITNNSQAPSANTRSRTRSNQNRGRSSSSRSPTTTTRLTRSSGSATSDTQTVQISDNRPTLQQLSASSTVTQNRTATNRRSTNRSSNNRQQSSSNNSNGNTNSDNLPGTSSGRRANRARGNIFNRIRGGGHQISSRIILNGVPITDSSYGMSGFLNGVPVPPGFLQGNLRNAGPQWWAQQGLRGPGSHGVHLIFGQGSDNMTYEQMIALDEESSLEPGQGLSKHDISQSTLTQSYKSSDNPNDKSSCNICLSEFDEGEKIRTLPCFHSFHTQCIDNWLNRKAECPVCRSPVEPP